MSRQLTYPTRSFLARAMSPQNVGYAGGPTLIDVERAIGAINRREGDLDDYECITAGISALLRSIETSNQRTSSQIAATIDLTGPDEQIVYAQQYASRMELEIQAAQELTNLLSSVLHERWYEAIDQANEEYFASLEDIASVEHERKPSARVISTGMDDDDWRCACGNDVTDSGFYPVDRNGAFYRDAEGFIDGPDRTLHPEWDGMHKCIVCGQRWRFDPSLNRQNRVAEAVAIITGGGI